MSKKYLPLHLLLIVILLYNCSDNNQKNFYNIKDFGAKSDSTYINTKSINDAINTCNKMGGGKVYVPQGIYYSGTINLKSNVTLYLESGAVIKGSKDTADYIKDGKRYGLFYTRNAKNITIEGSGEINGNGTYFHDPTQPHIAGDLAVEYTRQGNDFMNIKYGLDDGPIKYKYRPGMMMVFMKCENIKIKDVMLKDTPEWTMRVGDCDNVEVSGVSVHANLLVPNSDGIHCTNSRNVRISNCDIRCGDDAVIVSGFDENVGVHSGQKNDAAINTFEYGNKTGYAENIVVSNCLLQSRSAGIRIGYGNLPIRNCIFSNLVIYESNRGIGIFTRDSAGIENLFFNNIQIDTRLHKGHWWGKGEPIHVSNINREEGMKTGTIKNIRFNNINMTAETGVVAYSETANSIENIQFHNCNLYIKKSKIDEIYGGNIDLRPAFAVDKQIFKSDIPGYYIYNVKNIQMKDIQVGWASDLATFYTHGIWCKNVSGGYILNYIGSGASDKYKSLAIENSNIQIK
ncbi:MAG: glycosyl hydrolase family 28 protein [Cytophagales bacterium]|nr:glycosyl hydrolase family 28 protein [Cytophagales bacterium]